MFETLQPPRPEPVKDWYPAVFYGFWCVLGASGVGASFWKHGSTGRVGFVSYSAVFVLALFFFIAARTRLPTQRDMSLRCLLLLALCYLPRAIHMFSK